MEAGMSRSGAARLLCLPLVLLAMMLVPCEALYEDEIGHWDWHKQYLGRVTHAAFQTRTTGVRRVFVATEENAIASLTLRTGDIYWRRVLGPYDHIDALEYTSRKYIVTVSGGSSVRAWSEGEGSLEWEVQIPQSDTPPSLLVPEVDINGDGVADIFVGSGSVLCALSLLDGQTLWESDLSSIFEAFSIRKVQLSVDKTRIYTAGFLSTSGLAVAAVDLLTGEIKEHRRFHFSGILATDTIVLGTSMVVALNSEGSTILSADFLGDESPKRLRETPVGSLFSPTSKHAVLLPLKLEGAFALGIKSKTVVLKIGSGGSFRIMGTVKQPGGVSDSLTVGDNKHALSVFQSEGFNSTHQTFSFQVETNDWTDPLSKDLVTLPYHRGSLQKIFLNSYTRLDRSHGFRALVVGEDSSLSLLQQGEVVWAREDGLGSIIDTNIAELPLEKEGVSVSKVEHGLVDWLKGHWLKLKDTLMLATAEDKAALQEIRANSADKTKMTRDHNGFRKLLVVLTKAGKVHALHTGDGHIVWSLLVPAFRKKDDGTHANSFKLLPWQTPHQHALDENPVALVIGKQGAGADAPGVLSWVDVRTGQEVKHVYLSYPIKQVIPLPVTDASEQRLHLVIDNHQRGHLYPTSPESLSLFLDRLHNTYLYAVDKEKGSITGFVVKERINSGLEEKEGFVFETQKLWSIIFPADQERISTVVSRRLDEVVHTQAKVLGNRDVLYKYLNRNTVFVATVAPHSPGSLGAVTPDENWVVAYLIDTVTGRIIHRITHHQMIGPVQAVYSENWVVFTAFNLRTNRHELAVIEMYEKSRLADKGLLPLILGTHNASAPVSSYTNPTLDVKSQSYFFTHTIKFMSVTSTARGITSRQIILGLISDQVLALDKRFLDPRRTVNPTAAEKEEGILPLTDNLPIFPQSYLTHRYQVEGLRGIVAYPAGLESTSLVFAYGLDLFYTRTAPSKTYDSLTEEFSYALLLITIVALLVGILVTWVLSERKELADKWK